SAQRVTGRRPGSLGNAGQLDLTIATGARTLRHGTSRARCRARGSAGVWIAAHRGRDTRAALLADRACQRTAAERACWQLACAGEDSTVDAVSARVVVEYAVACARRVGHARGPGCACGRAAAPTRRELAVLVDLAHGVAAGDAVATVATAGAT